MTLLRVSSVSQTPSDEIDFVWHLHMTFTVHYRNFCNLAMNRFISHNPTEGG